VFVSKDGPQSLSQVFVSKDGLDSWSQVFVSKDGLESWSRVTCAHDSNFLPSLYTTPLDVSSHVVQRISLRYFQSKSGGTDSLLV